MSTKNKAGVQVEYFATEDGIYPSKLASEAEARLALGSPNTMVMRRTIITEEWNPDQPEAERVVITGHVKALLSVHEAKCVCCPTGVHRYGTDPIIESWTPDVPRYQKDLNSLIANALYQLPDGAKFTITVEHIPFQHSVLSSAICGRAICGGEQNATE